MPIVNIAPNGYFDVPANCSGCIIQMLAAAPPADVTWEPEFGSPDAKTISFGQQITFTFNSIAGRIRSHSAAPLQVDY
ncbi:hypothetical protein VRZ08_19320 [Rhodopseudomonas sp. G2_2311]|uniref:hypothetical protein n=1 Tax=Rhodopseudomonas sp. G2_2311 TaxID=3114287 RepID=UPI0024C977A3|nr:hypothetical protein KQX64_09830 [Rhodopseudomonas palustris]